MGESGPGNWTYADYLRLHELLELQGEGREINSDEMHFIIVHQTFELWFKQVIRELTEVRNILGCDHVPEDDIPRAVDHLGRTTEIFRLMGNQWAVLETLTPQGFLAFRDGLGTASGFESFQMREFEILLGLDNDDRIGGMDPLSSFRRMAEGDERSAAMLARLEDALLQPSLYESMMNWVERTPIMGSSYGSEGDAENVRAYIETHLGAHRAVCEEAAERSAGWGAGDPDKMAARMAAAHDGAVSFLMPEGEVSRARAGLLFIESYRELPLLTWPRTLIDAIVELEESMVKWRHSHARMVERIMGRRIGTGGTSGVDYLDATSQYRIFKDLWGVRTILVKPEKRPALKNAEFYGYTADS
ncbi:MAG: tryptophan 2,3-dioxygenase family protein [Candidatus Thalassarchaeum sp.]|jgi:tryptophan 2,3-dioxygenase|nr:tryptophan 2,3-dioxygenase family protein [Candidatus Thalassarchaeum sp.]HJM22919.1 tryptophan 2,3-dioxygenase family protein [Candidatus Thalassarchaeum sp.]|tara:strand:- start:24045 stop:25124 length:1080 start_codon:yes stop_codon:yes gene_type:complete